MKCKTKECENEATRRWVCDKCMAKFIRQVDAGLVTWSFLEMCKAVEPRKVLKLNSKF